MSTSSSSTLSGHSKTLRIIYEATLKLFMLFMSTSGVGIFDRVIKLSLR